MIAFWISALVITAAGAALMFRYSRRPVAVLSDPSQSVYRRQLTEIDDLADRGLMGEEERKSAYAEAARRLLNEPGESVEKPANERALTLAAAAIGLVGVAALIAYVTVGRPNLPGQPYAARFAQWEAAVERGEEIGALEYLAVLQSQSAEQPFSPQLHAQVGYTQMLIGDYLSAERRFERALQYEPDAPILWDLLATVRFEIAQEQVTPEVRQAAVRALQLDPTLMMPRYIMSLDAIENGQTETGLAGLRAILPMAGEDMRARIEEQIATVEAGGEIRTSVQSNPEILAMVEGLAARLEEQPNDPDGWASLVRSYAVLGDTEKLDAALAKARDFFRDSPRDLEMIEQAANLGR